MLVNSNVRNADSTVARAKLALQPPYFPTRRDAICVDTHQLSYSYMSFALCLCISTNWNAFLKHTKCSYEIMRNKFENGFRYDQIGKMGNLARIHPFTVFKCPSD